jgi:hypothetical protein
MTCVAVIVSSQMFDKHFGNAPTPAAFFEFWPSEVATPTIVALAGIATIIAGLVAVFFPDWPKSWLENGKKF